MPRRTRRPLYVPERAPYRSRVCHIGTHDACREAKPSSPPPGLRVTYEACTCPCHRGTGENCKGDARG
jgi:hypothetical protein